MPLARVVVNLLQSSFTVIFSEGHRRQSLGKVIVPIARIPTKATTAKNAAVTVAVATRRKF
tara:strand:- start:70 stop:252 length:183 start_codon:yes stop_codon:yes gene_type:complete